MEARARPGAVLEQGDEEQMRISRSEPHLQVPEPRDARVLQRVCDHPEVVEAEVVVLGWSERLVCEPENRDPERCQERERPARRSQASCSDPESCRTTSERRDPGRPPDRERQVPELKVGDEHREADPEVRAGEAVDRL